MSHTRNIVLIDGSNFYYKLKDLGLHHHRLLDFSFSAFARFLAGADTLIQTTYYIGKIRTDGTPQAQRAFDIQRRLFAHLKTHRVIYSLGYLLKTDGVFHEKGVDVHIAVDMLVATYENQCDRLILVSSDTDLLPAIKKARSRGKIVEYVGFSHQPSVALVANCTTARLLTKADLTPFLDGKAEKQAA